MAINGDNAASFINNFLRDLGVEKATNHDVAEIYRKALENDDDGII